MSKRKFVCVLALLTMTTMLINRTSIYLICEKN